MNHRIRRAVSGLAGAAALVALLGVSEFARADSMPEPMNRISFQVEASRDVVNDWIQAVIGVTEEDADAARLADRINTTMARALATAKKSAGVRVESGGYATQPIHQDGKLRRWRASQDLVLESADIDAVTALVGTLQAELQLRRIGFSISPERRRTVEDALIAEALAAFKARAEIVRKNLGARSYQVVQISLDTSGGEPPRPLHMQMEARVMSSAQVAPPALEGGSSPIAVHVSGTVELE